MASYRVYVYSSVWNTYMFTLQYETRRLSHDTSMTYVYSSIRNTYKLFNMKYVYVYSSLSSIWNTRRLSHDTHVWHRYTLQNSSIWNTYTYSLQNDIRRLSHDTCMTWVYASIRNTYTRFNMKYLYILKCTHCNTPIHIVPIHIEVRTHSSIWNTYRNTYTFPPDPIHHASCLTGK